MSAFEDLQATDAEIFKDPDAFPGVESVVYHPKGKSPVTVKANVFRNVPREEGGIISRELHIFVSTSDVPIVDVGGDVVTIPHRRGGTDQAHTVAEIISEDAGGFTLRLE